MIRINKKFQSGSSAARILAAMSTADFTTVGLIQQLRYKITKIKRNHQIRNSTASSH
jgi:hypothetical protein